MGVHYTPCACDHVSAWAGCEGRDIQLRTHRGATGASEKKVYMYRMP